MNNFCRIYRIFCYRFKSEISGNRIFLIIVVLSIFLYNTLHPIVIFCETIDMKVTPWVFPFITNDYIVQMILMVSAVMIFCNAPFIENANMFILARAGKINMLLGHFVYIITFSLLYVLTIIFISVISLLPNILLSSGWGKVLGTLARTDISTKINLQMNVNDYIIGAYTPFSATIISALLEWACTAWFGLWIYSLNSVFKRSVGTVSAAAIVLLDLMITNGWKPSAYAISPLTLAQISSFSGEKLMYGINLRYSVLFYSISICCLFLLALIGIQRDKINFSKKGVSNNG